MTDEKKNFFREETHVLNFPSSYCSTLLIFFHYIDLQVYYNTISFEVQEDAKRNLKTIYATTLPMY